MTETQLRALAFHDAPPEGVDVFTWWIAPFLVDCDRAAESTPKDRAEIQLDIFDSTEAK